MHNQWPVLLRQIFKTTGKAINSKLLKTFGVQIMHVRTHAVTHTFVELEPSNRAHEQPAATPPIGKRNIACRIASCPPR